MTITHAIYCAKYAFSGAQHEQKNSITIDSYFTLRRLDTLLSGNKRFMRIFAEAPWSRVVENGDCQ